jgi:hypothetical protein
MGNPYYTPPPDPVAPLMKQAATLMQFKQDRDYKQAKLAEDRKYHQDDLQLRYNKHLLDMGKDQHDQQQLAFDKTKNRQEQAQLPQHKKMYTDSWHNQRLIRLKKIGGPEMVAALKPVTDGIEGIAKQNKSFLEVYRDVRPAMGYYAKQALPKMKSLMEKKLEDPNWMTSVAGREFMQLFDEFSRNPEAVADKMFGATVQSYQAEQQEEQMKRLKLTGEVVKSLRADPTNEMRLLKEYDSIMKLPNNHPMASLKPRAHLLLSAIKQAKDIISTSTTTPDGTTHTTSIGPADAVGAANNAAFENLQTKTQGKIEEKIIDIDNKLARTEGLIQRFDPKYLDMAYRFEQTFAGFRDKTKNVPIVGGVWDMVWGNLSQDQRREMQEYYGYQVEAIQHVNLTIKEMTGAQMNEHEAKRIRLSEPDFGEAWWKGNDPEQFKAKMMRSHEMSLAAKARYNMYRQQGLTHSEILQRNGIRAGDDNDVAPEISLEKINQMIDEDARKFEAAGMAPEQIDAEIKAKWGI